MCCDYALSVAITTYNDEVAKEMNTLVQPEYGTNAVLTNFSSKLYINNFISGINSFKFFMAYADYMLNDGEFYHAMRHCAELGALARVHAENGYVILEKQKELLDKGVTGPEGHSQSRPEEVWVFVTDSECRLLVFQLSLIDYISSFSLCMHFTRQQLV